ncbi:MAG: hypothetical protein JWM12_2960 [Ilumatobacteraceae bacterium]|nr:hypothetical protein [Ilumatobacteraceae bacterium]
MNTATKLAAFAAVLAVGFGGAAAVGATAGPIGVTTSSHSTHVTGTSGVTEHPRGLAVAEAGYRLRVETSTITAGAPSQFGFAIVDDRGEPITSFDPLHERALHLIVLSRNLVDYLHLHPTMDSSGRWTVDLPPLQPGSYRVFADFQPTGADNLTLGTDVTVPGDVPGVDVPLQSSVANVDGYTVTMTGTPELGDTELRFTVELAGHVVRTDPYLGAAGHLVAIRDGDLAYLHVHPHDDETSAITFTGEFPTPGTYRLFFDFSHDGNVRTAAFTVVVPDAAAHDRVTPSPAPGGH